MPPFKLIKRQELIRYFKRLGFSEPKAGGNHQYMVKGRLKLFIHNYHRGEIIDILPALKGYGVYTSRS